MPFTAAQSEVHAALDQAEHCVAAVSVALLQGSPEQVKATTRELHDCAHALALVLRGVDGSVVLAESARERLVIVAREIAMQREALLRRSAVVERSLKTLVPQQNRSSTYSDALGRYAGHGTSGSIFRSV